MAASNGSILQIHDTTNDANVKEPKPIDLTQLRTVHSNDTAANLPFKYPNNRIRTTKYTVLTFLPINLFEQFHRFANIYFLAIVILSLIPATQALNPATAALPLVFVLTVSALKDGIEDIRRGRNDKEINSRLCKVIKNGSVQGNNKITELQWQEVEVGDIIEMENNEFVAADLLLLSSSEEDGLCYIDTSSMDGETNLKIRESFPVTKKVYTDATTCSTLKCVAESEQPNNNIYRFEGRVKMDGNVYPVTITNMLLRGCILRNTERVYGLVLYTGHDTKLMMNGGAARLKRSHLEQLMNKMVILVFIFLVVCCTILAILTTVWQIRIAPEQWQVDSPDSASLTGFITFWSFLLILQTLVPISLYITVEVTKVAQTWFIAQDIEMYDPETNRSCTPRTSALSEELGQVEYIFSDKTGTLTQNVMEFYGCIIGEQVYGTGKLAHTEPVVVSPPLSKYSNPSFAYGVPALVEASRVPDNAAIRDFWLTLALCHTVVIETEDQTSTSHYVPKYNAQSPDEAALVAAARDFGYAFYSRTTTSITIDALGTTEVYELLNVLEFNSDRKRMSVIVRDKGGNIILLTKGADDKILALLDKSEENSNLAKTTRKYLAEFARDGLRTLCLGKRVIPQGEYLNWLRQYNNASLVEENREQAVDDAAALIENNLTLLGATAVEDKLQVGVPETIAALALAGVKLWVLTGDKQETAINIGFSCRLLTDDMNIMIVNATSPEETLQEMRECQEVYVQRSKVGRDGPKHLKEFNALVIDGHTLLYALDDICREKFLDLALTCNSVVCCRCSPAQKAQVVNMVRHGRKVITLAIGDGANDVPMIRSAEIGIGISGREGMQAVLASDYSIPQFRCLKTLILKHGVWYYRRNTWLILYFFYKNFAFTMANFWFALTSGFSAQTVYEYTQIMLYNIIFTSLPPIIMALFDQHIPAGATYKMPGLYRPGLDNRYFNMKVFWLVVLDGFYQSLILYYFAQEAIAAFSSGKMADVFSLGTTVYIAVCITVNLKVALEMNAWTWMSHFAIWGSIFVLFIYILLYQSILPGSNATYGDYTVLFNQGQFWFTIAIGIIGALLPFFVIRYIRIMYFPAETDIVREMVLLKMDPFDEKEPTRTMSKPKFSRDASLVAVGDRANGTERTHTGYAFSHSSGWGRWIMGGFGRKKNSKTASNTLPTVLPTPASGLSGPEIPPPEYTWATPPPDLDRGPSSSRGERESSSTLEQSLEMKPIL